MLNHEETLALINRAQSGDDNAKETLIQENMPLIKSIVKRFKGRLEYDDLMQLGAMGFTKAMMGFDEKFGVRFSTYAVPMITGEIKRFLRDDGVIKVSRYSKLLAYKITAYIDEIEKSGNPSPTVDELSKVFNCDQGDIILALDSSRMVLSLNESLDDDEELTLGDKIADKNTPESDLNRLIIKDAVANLPERERKIIYLRYFRDKTQSDVASELGVSQVQVSRLENKILAKIKNNFNEHN
ncbi:MAG: sigma-70 family RNA polymerase sigma factor [Clostridia bacterium]|nr:sigma-70 family RNA polymerase sigma factor [Clostridia bacterium]